MSIWLGFSRVPDACHIGCVSQKQVLYANNMGDEVSPKALESYVSIAKGD